MENKKKLKILVVEDDPNLGTILSEYLEAKGYETELCTNGQKGFDAFIANSFDFCILDIMMPVKDGFTLAKEIRKTDKIVPMIFLTAKAMKEDTIEGLKIGADDYVTKPFSMEELLLRIKAVLRRTTGDTETGKKREQLFLLGKYRFDYNKRLITIGKEHENLTSKENELLRLLCVNVNDILERSYALKVIWEDDSYFNSRSMDVYIAKLRKYLKEDPQIEIINVHGKGFKLMVSGT